MAERVVIRRTRGSQDVSRTFNFSSDMVPALQENWLGPKFLKDYRTAAWAQYESLPMPTTSDEAWRRTDIRGLKGGSFVPVSGEGIEANILQPPDELLDPLIGEIHGGQILISAGKNQSEIDPVLVEQGVVFTDLATTEREHPELLQKIIGQVVQSDEGKFAALAAAMAQSGVLLYVPKNVIVEQPLHSVTYIHEAASPTEAQGQTMHAGIVEIHVGDGANLKFVELQSWGEHVWNFSHERAVVGRDGNLEWIFGAIGSHLTKNFSDLDLIGDGSVGRMSGFYFTDGTQHLDHDTQQNHLAPNTSSDLLFKGALIESSRSVWQGMIYVAPGAQKTDGYQANRNLVLSDSARADSIPGLEILADDVRCTHGATVGKIDPDEVFYLQSRGLPTDIAERIIVEGFFDPIMQRIPFERVRERFQQAILEKMS
jgi:Fe-S cluster assembly protein SufD